LEPLVRADIVICVPVLRRAARTLNKPLYDHLAHLIVHGVLHAHGHRHDATRDALNMESLEARVLGSLGK
ncbi:MAG: rRNA maturation RNase YbeY, partial [Burkholderiaceae bacterium]